MMCPIKKQDRFSDEQNVTYNISNILKKKIMSLELIDDVGFADLSKYRKVEGGKTPFDFLSDAKVGIIYIARIKKVIEKYGKWYVVSLNNFLKQYNSKIVRLLESYGLYSLGIIDERFNQKLIGKISFRQLAVLAGLGTIGKNSCLLHPLYGPGVLIGVIFTNAHLLPDRPLETSSICMNCDLCVVNCPVRAIYYDEFDRHRCKDRRKILGKGCGTPCITCCPVSRENHSNYLKDHVFVSVAKLSG